MSFTFVSLILVLGLLTYWIPMYKYDIGRRVWVVVLAIRKASAIDVLIRVIRK
jgi:hypothetical protein